MSFKNLKEEFRIKVGNKEFHISEIQRRNDWDFKTKTSKRFLYLATVGRVVARRKGEFPLNKLVVRGWTFGTEADSLQEFKDNLRGVIIKSL